MIDLLIMLGISVAFFSGAWAGCVLTTRAFTSGKLDGLLAQHGYFKSGRSE